MTELPQEEIKKLKRSRALKGIQSLVKTLFTKTSQKSQKFLRESSMNNFKHIQTGQSKSPEECFIPKSFYKAWIIFMSKPEKGI